MAKKKVPSDPMAMGEQLKFREISFVVPASSNETTIRINVEYYQGPGTAWKEMQPLLGDGFVPPDKVRWMGREWSLKRVHWDMLSLLLNSPEKRLLKTVFIHELWPDVNDPDNSVKTEVSRLNTALNQMKFWLRASVRSDHVVLEMSGW